MATTAERMRMWRGPAILSYGFRPFFLGGAFWSVVAMGFWIAMLSGALLLPTAFDPISWHAHEFLFGYLGAVIAGFMMTAVPNWTGRLPIVGVPLAGLFALWAAGRIAVAVSAQLPAPVVAAVDLSFGLALAGVMTREIVAGRNWRNLVIVGMLAVFILSNAIFHWEAAQGFYAGSGYGLRLGLGTAMMMIAVIGGRIIPSFTRNWLANRGARRLPTPPMQRLDKATLALFLVTLLIWVALPQSLPSALLLLMSSVMHLIRLARWHGLDSLAEPLVFVLHVAYLFLPLGALALGTEILSPGVLGMVAAQHLWMGGAIGLMTLAVMSRATLGHTGRPLVAGVGTVSIYLALTISVIARVVAGVWPEHASALHIVSGLTWIAAFGGFCLIYGPLLLRSRPASAS